MYSGIELFVAHSGILNIFMVDWLNFVVTTKRDYVKTGADNICQHSFHTYRICKFPEKNTMQTSFFWQWLNKNGMKIRQTFIPNDRDLSIPQ